MNKPKTSMILFSCVCSSISVFTALLCIYIVFKAIMTQVLIGPSLMFSFVGIILTVVLTYFSRMPLIGNAREELKKTTPIAPNMHKYRTAFYCAALLICVTVVMGVFNTQTVDISKKQAAKDFLLEEGHISSTAFFNVVPDVFMDKIYASSILLEAAQSVQDNPESEEAIKLYEDAQLFYDTTLASKDKYLLALIISLALSGFFVTSLRLRIDYVMRLKEVGDY